MMGFGRSSSSSGEEGFSPAALTDKTRRAPLDARRPARGQIRLVGTHIAATVTTLIVYTDRRGRAS